MSFNWYYFLFIQPNGITSVHYRHIKITLHYKSLPVELKLRSRDTFLLFSRHAGRPLFLSWFVFVIFCQFAIDFVHFFLDGTLVLSKVHVPMKQPWTIFTIFTSYPAHYNNIPQYHKLEACWMQQDPSGSNTKNERSFVLCLVQQNPTEFHSCCILLHWAWLRLRWRFVVAPCDSAVSSELLGLQEEPDVTWCILFLPWTTNWI